MIGSGFSAANRSCASTASWISGKGMGTFLTVELTHVISINTKDFSPFYRECLNGSSQIVRILYVVENCVFLPAEGKQNATFSPEFKQPGKSL